MLPKMAAFICIFSTIGITNKYIYAQIYWISFYINETYSYMAIICPYNIFEHISVRF